MPPLCAPSPGQQGVSLRCHIRDTASEPAFHGRSGDSAVVCHFYPYEYHHLAESLSAAGGWEDFSIEEVNQIGWRIINMSRLFVLSEGSTHNEDRLSARAYYALKDGPIAEKTMDSEELAKGMQAYFRLMGWDEEGVPCEATLEKYGLEEFV